MFTFVNVIHKMPRLKRMTRRDSAQAKARSVAKLSRIERRDVVTNAILDEAVRLFQVKGPDGITLQRVAEGLGYATTAIYRYFDSKEAMIVALQRRALQQLKADLVDTLSRSSDESPLCKLALAGLFYAHFPARSPEAFRLIALSLADPAVMMADSQAALVSHDVALLLSLLRELVEQAVRAGDLPKQKFDRSALLWTQLQGVLSVRKLGRLPGLSVLQHPELIEHAIAMVLVGLGAPPEAAALALKKGKRLLNDSFTAKRGTT